MGIFFYSRKYKKGVGVMKIKLEEEDGRIGICVGKGEFVVDIDLGYRVISLKREGGMLQVENVEESLDYVEVLWKEEEKY